MPEPMAIPFILAVLATAGAVLCGVGLGYALGVRSGRRELSAFKQGQQLEHEHTLMREKNRGGPCYVRAQLPPSADE